MKVTVKHGTGIYKGTRYKAGDTLEISELYFESNPGRFEVPVKRTRGPNKKKDVAPAEDTSGVAPSESGVAPSESEDAPSEGE